MKNTDYLENMDSFLDSYGLQRLSEVYTNVGLSAVAVAMAEQLGNISPTEPEGKMALDGLASVNRNCTKSIEWLTEDLRHMRASIVLSKTYIPVHFEFALKLTKEYAEYLTAYLKEHHYGEENKQG